MADPIAYNGNSPYSFGQKMGTDATREEWRQASGFDFEIKDAPVDFGVNGERHTFDGKRVLYRNDTVAPFSVVSGRYQIVQPRQVEDFFFDTCAKLGFKMESMGVLKGGGVYWGLARTGLNGTVNGDKHDNFVLMSSSADLSLATTACNTAVRMVCGNMLQMALRRATGEKVRIKHSTTFDPYRVIEQLGLVDYEASWEQFRQTMGELGDKPVTDKRAKDFFAELLRPKDQRAKGRNSMNAGQFNQLLNAPVGGGYTPVQTDKDRAIRGLESLIDCYYTAPGAVPGTAYGLMQGVTRYIDHERGKDADKRLTSAWFGQGETVKQRALEMALAM